MNKCIYIMALAIFSLPLYAHANSCKVDGYTIGFFNGVATSKKQAKTALIEIKSTINTSKYNGEKVSYSLFYNDSNIDDGALNVLSDFAETFDQRTTELDIRLNNKWEVFWQIVDGQQSSGIIDYLGSLFDGFIDLVNSLVSTSFNQIIKTFLEGLTTLSGMTPNTQDVRLRHHLINDSLAWQGEKLIYIAHSQGNLWVNESYEDILSQEGYNSSNIKVIHIAPASTEVKGDYVLSKNDIVINGLNFTGIGSVQEANVTAEVTDADILGHGLIEVYLSDPSTRSMIVNSVEKAFRELKKPEIEDHLFEFTFQHSANYFQSYSRTDIDIVDNKDNWMNFPYFQTTTPYFHNISSFKYKIEKSNKLKPLSSSVKSAKNSSKVFTVEECKDIPNEKPYVVAEYSQVKPENWYNLPPNTRTTVTVRDRYGKKLHDYDISINEYKNNGWLYIGSLVDFKVKRSYSDKEKVLLKRLKLSGKYQMYSENHEISYSS